MKNIRLKRALFMPLFLLISLSTHTLASATETAAPVEIDTSTQDPERWYQSNDTPKQHYQNLLQDANAAYAQVLKEECKPLKGKAAKTCRKEAGASKQSDVARAQRIYNATSENQ